MDQAQDAQTSGDKMIDWRRVQDLRSEIGPNCFDELVSLFLKETDEVVARLPTVTDARAMENDLHFLKGSALNLGFADLATVCQSGEGRAATGAVDIAVDVVISIYNQSRAAFLGGLQSLAA